MNVEKPILVTCAIIERDGKILAALRPRHKDQGGKWEFPGGKLHPHETPSDGIVREIWEELCVDVIPWTQLPTVEHVYPNKTVALIPFVCNLVDGDPHPNEHEKIAWLLPDELGQLDWCEADAHVLSGFLKSRG